MTPSSYGPFDIELSTAQREKIARLNRRAIGMGLGPAFVDDLRSIFERLQKSPREWGDPLFHFKELKMIMYRGIHAKISVTYGVHDRLPLVFVSRIDLILNHPLAE
jgi:hypothetical protein